MVVFQCSICMGPMSTPLVLDGCKHTFCSECITQWMDMQTGAKRTCPFCRKEFTRANMIPLLIESDVPENISPESRMHSLAQRKTEGSGRIEAWKARHDPIVQQLRAILQAKSNEINRLEQECHDRKEQQKVHERTRQQMEKTIPLLQPCVDKTVCEYKSRGSRQREPMHVMLLGWKQAVEELANYEKTERKRQAAMERLTRLRESQVKRKQKLSGFDQNEVVHRLGPQLYEKVRGLMGWKTLGPVTPPVKRALATVNSNKPWNGKKSRQAFTNFFNDADDFNSGDSGLESQIDSSNLLDESPRPARLSLDDRASPDSVLPLPMQHRAKKANRCEKQRLLYAGFDSQYGSGSGRNL